MIKLSINGKNTAYSFPKGVACVDLYRSVLDILLILKFSYAYASNDRGSIFSKAVRLSDGRSVDHLKPCL